MVSDDEDEDEDEDELSGLLLEELTELLSSAELLLSSSELLSSELLSASSELSKLLEDIDSSEPAAGSGSFLPVIETIRIIIRITSKTATPASTIFL